MPPILRFLLRPIDLARVLPGSIQIDETAPVATPAWDGIYPQTLILRFQILDPGLGPPELVPLFPGMLRFLPEAGGTLPTPTQVSPANYANWTTRGLLSNSAALKQFQQTVDTAAAALEVAPNIAWFGPVRLTSNFLFSNFGRNAQATSSPNSALQKRISSFLRGEFALRLALAADRTQDDVVKQRLPVVDMAPDGSVELQITVARQQITLDGPKELLDGIYGPLDPVKLLHLPSHPLNGVIPARHVYRTLGQQGELIDFVGPLAETVARDWDVDPTQPRYFPIWFRRIFGAAQESSVHFPWHFARITSFPLPAPLSAITELRLPTHGVVFLPLTQVQAQTTEYLTELVQSGGGSEHELRILAGTPDAWRRKAGTVPLQIDLNPGPVIIQARRRMKIEMLVEPGVDPGEDRCTYLTLRRSVRALVNNRILGGRLNSGVVQPRTSLRTHLEAVLTGANYPASLFPLRFFDTSENLFDEAQWRELLGTQVNRLFSGNRNEGIMPDSPAARARRLEPFWIAFFPEPAPQEVFPEAPPADAKIWPLGKVVYHLWQTLIADFADDRTRRNFLNQHVGRGGAGALIAAGLATGFVSAPDPFPLRAAAPPAEVVGHMNALVDNLMQHGEPGAICQFYSRHEDFREIAAARQTLPDYGGEGAYGHSPVFVRAVPPGAELLQGGLLMIDQFGERIWPRIEVNQGPGLVARLVQWIDGRAERVWAAANWDE